MEVFFHVCDGRPEGIATLDRMPAPEFYRLLEAHRRNHKPR